MGSLYKHFIEEITQNTKPNAYLIPDPVRVNFWKERLSSLGKGPYIGISWKSSVVSPTAFNTILLFQSGLRTLLSLM